MSDFQVTNINIGSVILRDATSADESITFAGAATLLAGTILARDSVSGLLVPYVVGGAANDNDIPKAVLTYELVATAAGNLPARVMIDGQVRTERLVIDADGDASNVDGAVRDALRLFGIVAVDITELNILDNQ